MTKATHVPTATPLCDQLKATGNWNPNWDSFYALDPRWTEQFMDMGTAPMLSGVLDAKTIEFIAIAVDASCTHMYAPGVRRHIRKALELGASKEEITADLRILHCNQRHIIADRERMQEELRSIVRKRIENAGRLFGFRFRRQCLLP